MIEIHRTGDEKPLADVPSCALVLDDVMLTNVQKGSTRPPPGEPWQYFLFATETRKQGVERRYIITITGKSGAFCDQQLVTFLDQYPNVSTEQPAAISDHG